MSLGYRYVIAQQAADFALRLPPSEQQRLASACRLLAAQPFRTGDYSTRDDAGRMLQNLLIDDWVLTYWSDHAVKEVRIVELAQV